MPKKRGGQTSEISKRITHSAHGAAMNPQQPSEFFDQTGCVCANDVGLRRMLRHRKDDVEFLGGEQFRKNWTGHNGAIITKYGEKNIITHVDSERKVYQICS